MSAVFLILLGTVFELVGILLGVLEIGRARRVTRNYIARTRPVGSSLQFAWTVDIPGSASLTGGPPISFMEQVDQRLDTLESGLADAEQRLATLPSQLREQWQTYVDRVNEAAERAAKEQEIAVDKYVGDINAGNGRWWAIGFLAGGAVFQAVGGVVSAWPHH